MGRGCLLVVAAFLSMPRSAAAQGPAFGEDSLPLAADLKKAPIGSWSEYEIRKQGDPPVSVRVALIARDRKTVTVEMRVDLPPFNRPTRRKMVVQIVVPLDPKSGTGGPAVLQVDGHAAMKTAGAGSLGAGFERPDVRGFKGEEMMAVRAGKYRTRHYESDSEDWTSELWTSDAVFPIGVVKMKRDPATVLGGLIGQQDLKAAPVAASPTTGATPVDPDEPFFPESEIMQLTATGTGARSAITGPVRRFDPKLFQQHLTAP